MLNTNGESFQNAIIDIKIRKAIMAMEYNTLFEKN